MANLVYNDQNTGITVYTSERTNNGQPRYIIHFLNFLSENERDSNDVLKGYALAVRKAKKYGTGWRKYSRKEFAGGLIKISNKTPEEIASEVMRIMLLG